MPLGRPPKPTALKLLTGNPGKRPLNTREPKPPVDGPSCPSWLLPEAKREWRRIVPSLKALGLLAKIDRVALAGYCQSWAKWRQADEYLGAHGLSVELTRADREGNEVVYAIQQRPEVAISQKERQLANAFLAKFGLSPSDRSRVKADEKPQADPFEDFLTNGGAH